MPKVLGRYHIISELGRGGMGVVYKAVDPKLERFIAIKCLSEELSNDEITVSRFLREARNVAALSHPNIAQIFLADEDEGKPYFVMEFIDGESLAERLARDQRLMPEQARRIVTECAEALKAAHEENIVHRDIKPGNIMIDRRGRSVLTDFGIAGIVHPDQQPKESKFIMGTPGYLPPEVMTGRAADHRGDIFALGAVYYEMLVGKRLVPGKGIEDTARTLMSADFPELGDLDEQLDEATFGALGRMLAPDPDKRYQDYDALLADLNAGQAPAIKLADPVSEPTRVATPPPSAPVATTEPPATEAIDATAVEPPTTLTSPPPAGRHRVRNASLIGVGVLGLVALTLGAVRFAPDSVDQFTAWWSDADESAAETAQPALTVGDDRPSALAAVETVDDPGSRDAVSVDSQLGFGRMQESESLDQRAMADTLADTGEAIESESYPERQAEPVPDLDRDSAIAADQQDMEPAEKPEARLSAATARVVEFGEADQASLVESPAAEPEYSPMPREAEPEDPPRSAPLVVASAPESRPAAVAEPSRVPAAAPAASRPATEPAPAPAARPATGILVLGVGDPVFVEPMVREVEQALGEQGHELIERGYVRGLSALLADPELDLAELSRAALDAGAGKAVLVRAMPAGERQLQYYGRLDTAFIVQTETVVYDLNQRQRLGASNLEQVEYTALNATRQARDTIAPRLALISEQLE